MGIWYRQYTWLAVKLFSDLIQIHCYSLTQETTLKKKTKNKSRLPRYCSADASAAVSAAACARVTGCPTNSAFSPPPSSMRRTSDMATELSPESPAPPPRSECRKLRKRALVRYSATAMPICKESVSQSVTFTHTHRNDKRERDTEESAVIKSERTRTPSTNTTTTASNAVLGTELDGADVSMT